MDVEALPGIVMAGASPTIVGELACPNPADAAAQTVTVFQHSAGTPGFSAAGTTSTGSNGAYQFTSEALDTNSAFYAVAHAVRSGRTLVKVAPSVSISGVRGGAQPVVAGHRALASASTSNTVTFTGTVGPNDQGAIVALQREDGAADERWRRIALGEVGIDGKYSITHTFGIPGHANIRVVVRPRGLNVAGASEPLAYDIAQRQNPRLTIEASSDLLSYGEGVTFSGTAAGATHEPLTLLARTRGAGFAPVASVSDSAGHYDFPAQLPLQSTFYIVRSARASSALLVEHVAPVLSAQVSSASVQSGQQLTFSGTIAPDHAGHVYLQRESPAGIDFKTVHVGAVEAGSTYSISHTIVGTGTQIYRIEVPSDGERQGAASRLFKVQVTPARAVSLEPQAPGAISPAPEQH